MKLTIEQKQEVYEKLLELDCPDLLAALIAERNEIRHPITLGTFISGGFFWDESPEGQEFWQYMHECVEELEEDFLPYDTEPDKTKDAISIETISPAKICRPLQHREHLDYITQQETKVSLLDKTKLFFGKLFYKV